MKLSTGLFKSSSFQVTTIYLLLFHFSMHGCYGYHTQTPGIHMSCRTASSSVNQEKGSLRLGGRHLETCKYVFVQS